MTGDPIELLKEERRLGDDRSHVFARKDLCCSWTHARIRRYSIEFCFEERD
jgi:hypothetical protein